eukprot:3932992-Rhodomonas_salina.2
MHRQVVRRERLLVERVCRLKLVGKDLHIQQQARQEAGLRVGAHFVCGAQGVQRVSELLRSIDGEVLERPVAELELFILIKRLHQRRPVNHEGTLDANKPNEEKL